MVKGFCDFSEGSFRVAHKILNIKEIPSPKSEGSFGDPLEIVPISATKTLKQKRTQMPKASIPKLFGQPQEFLQFKEIHYLVISFSSFSSIPSIEVPNFFKSAARVSISFSFNTEKRLTRNSECFANTSLNVSSPLGVN